MWPILSVQFIFIRTGVEEIISEISLILIPQSFLFNYGSLSQKSDLFLFQSSLLSRGVTQSCLLLTQLQGEIKTAWCATIFNTNMYEF